MTARSQILFLYPSAGRDQRRAAIERGEAPGEMFYGALHLEEKGVDIVYGNTRQDPRGALNNLLLLGERLFNRLSNFGHSRQRVAALRQQFDGATLALSFNDAFSISLGRHCDLLNGQARLVGGFHGLADMVEEAAPLYRPVARRIIGQAVERLDHLFFFGEADRLESIHRYAIVEDKTSLFLFGVDGGFWCPDAAVEAENFVLSVGSDPKRDYATLLAAPIDAPLRIVTRLPIAVPPGRRNVEVLRGNFYQSPITDLVLRDFYRRAAVVVVPLRDVFQPSGYSVALQAMACGKPLVLSRIKGLWDPDLYVSGENCLLVPPGDPSAIGAAVKSLMADPGLRRHLGLAARETALEHFGLDRMNRSLDQLIARQ
jgi:glycosyltransferase involved in cell wall biosynthesis